MKIKLSSVFPINWEKHPFLYGLFSLGDIGGNNSLFDEPRISDAEALRRDWEKVGNDMRISMNIYGKGMGVC